MKTKGESIEEKVGIGPWEHPATAIILSKIGDSDRVKEGGTRSHLKKFLLLSEAQYKRASQVYNFLFLLLLDTCLSHVV